MFTSTQNVHWGKQRLRLTSNKHDQAHTYTDMTFVFGVLSWAAIFEWNSDQLSTSATCLMTNWHSTSLHVLKAVGICTWLQGKGMSAPQFCYSLIGQGLFCAFCVCNTFQHLGWSGTGQSAGQPVDQLLAYRRGLIGSSCLVNKDVTSSMWDILSIGELQQTRCVVNFR